MVAMTYDATGLYWGLLVQALFPPVWKEFEISAAYT